MRPRSAILIAAALLFVVAHYVPFGDVALYPLTLFTTWVHEMGHGLTALIVGGRFESLDIYRNASGLAYAYAAWGWPDALVAAGGLLAPPIVGAVILAVVHGPRRSRILLGLLAAALVVSMVICVRTPVGIAAMTVVALALGWAAWKLDGDHRVIVVAGARRRARARHADPDGRLRVHEGGRDRRQDHAVRRRHHRDEPRRLAPLVRARDHHDRARPAVPGAVVGVAPAGEGYRALTFSMTNRLAGSAGMRASDTERSWAGTS